MTLLEYEGLKTRLKMFPTGLHPRWPKGDKRGGQFAPKGIGSLIAAPPAYKMAKEVFSAINGTHRIPPGAPKIDVRLSEGISPDHGRLYYNSKTNKPDFIVMNSKGSKMPHLDFAHEVGHYLDHTGNHSKQNSPEFKRFMGAVQKTESYQRWKKWQDQGYIEVKGSRYKVPDSVYSYFLRPSELYARAYSQQVARKSRIMQNELESVRRTSQVPIFWSDREFAQISSVVLGVAEAQ